MNLPAISDKLNAVVPDFKSQLIRIQNPKLGATPKGNGVVIQNRRHNERPIQNGGNQNSVLELGELVAEPTVGGVPEEHFSRRDSEVGTSPPEERPGASRKREKRRENEDFGGDEEGDYGESGEKEWYSVIAVDCGPPFRFPGDSAAVMVAGIHLHFVDLYFYLVIIFQLSNRGNLVGNTL